MGQDPLRRPTSGRGACLITALMVLISAAAFLVPMLVAVLRS